MKLEVGRHQGLVEVLLGSVLALFGNFFALLAVPRHLTEKYGATSFSQLDNLMMRNDNVQT